MDTIIKNSLAVDAACSGNPGVMEYRGVYTATGEVIFHKGPFRQATNNIGEFLALVHGLALLHQQGSPLPVYSDSVSAMAWVRNKKAKTTLPACAENQILFELIARAEKWLRTHEYANSILKWDTRTWGEIPADFGRKS
jgi:ribonuclease HI